MSYISFDYKCANSACSIIQHRMVKREVMDEQVCEECDTFMAKMPPATRTTFRFADTKLKPS